MKGDFSQLRHLKPAFNLDGVLHQQGRVFSDTDFNDAFQIARHWRDQAARDVIGARVAAVPVQDSGGFQVTAAAVSGQNVTLTLNPGRIWADGLLAQLGETAPVTRTARYFTLPVQSPAAAAATIGDGVRDVVVLQVVRESLSAFQMAPVPFHQPAALLEPALGGPDTTERCRMALSYFLYRLKAGEDCQTIAAALAGGPKGLLAVTLDEPKAGDGDCPVFEGGGYRGFEHALCRVECIRGPGAEPWFAFSRVNGGLTGRGDLNLSLPAAPRLIITHNLPAILHGGLASFYLEIVTEDGEDGWSTVYGAPATLDSGDLKLDPVGAVGALPAAANVFFRLWERREKLSSFTASPTKELADGIHLRFDSADPAKYELGDYWTFTVRAGEIENPLVLIGTQSGAVVTGEAPQGPPRHRVALAEINWTAAKDTKVSGTIEDCRKRFRPLTNLKVCCTFLVGDGVTSFGDFDSLETAFLHLPPWGGKLCLLPGIHFANLSVSGRANIFIHGCRGQTYVLPRPNQLNQPIIAIADSHAVEVEDLTLIGLGAPTVEFTGSKPEALRDVMLRNCRVLGIEHALRVTGGSGMEILHNMFIGWDRKESGALVSVEADDLLIEDNLLRVFPAGSTPSRSGGDDDDPHGSGPGDPCADLNRFVGEKGADLVWSAVYVLVSAWTFLPPKPYRALGGLHLRPGCERVRVLQNTIYGGQGNGITLGGRLSEKDAGPAPGSGEGGSHWPDKLRPRDSMSAFPVAVRNEGGTKLAGVPVTIQVAPAGVSQTKTTTSPEGSVFFSVDLTDYLLSVGGGWKIVKVTELPGGGMGWLVIVEAVAVENFTGFLHEIEIRENDIQDMGLAGIGYGEFAGQPSPEVKQPVPPDLKNGTPTENLEAMNEFIGETVDALIQQFLVPLDLAQSTSPVAGLTIADNHIHGCVQNPYDDLLRKRVMKNGLGGIALGLVDDCTLSGNRITGNGRAATDPVCGIYAGHVDGLEITGNHVTGNGPVTEDYEQNKLAGIRGGIVIRYAGTRSARQSLAPSTHPAIRVHDNRVDQPAGRALSLIAAGPVSICGNYLSSDRTGKFTFIDQLCGGVLVADFGGLHRLVDRWYARNLNQALNRSGSESEFPSGPVLMSGNQIRMGRHNNAVFGVVAGAAEDVSFENNQSLRHAREFYLNTLLLAPSIRAIGSRFIEDGIPHCQSLITWMLQDSASTRYGGNITTLNQGDHCITAFPAPSGKTDPWPTIWTANQVADTWCADQKPDQVRQDLIEVVIAALGIRMDDTLLRMSGKSLRVSGRTVAASAARGVVDSRAAAQPLYDSESARLTQKYGAGDLRAMTFAARAAGKSGVQAEARQMESLLSVHRASPSGTGEYVIDGFVTDATGAGRGGLVVQLTAATGGQALSRAKTGEGGYFTFVLKPTDHGIQSLASTGARVAVDNTTGTAVLSKVVKPVANAVVTASITLPGTVGTANPNTTAAPPAPEKDAFPGLKEFYARWTVRGTTAAAPAGTTTPTTPKPSSSGPRKSGPRKSS